MNKSIQWEFQICISVPLRVCDEVYFNKLDGIFGTVSPVLFEYIYKADKSLLDWIELVLVWDKLVLDKFYEDLFIQEWLVGIQVRS